VNEFTKAAAPAGRAQQKEETRARILAVARGHFEREGFEAANIRAIAHEAEVAPGTVLLHFPDKRQLLHAALFEDLERVVDDALKKRGGARLETRLRAIADALFSYYRARPKLSRTLLREALVCEPPWRERYAAQVGRVHAHVVSLASAAKERGELTPEADEALVSASFLSFYYFALLGWAQEAVADPAPMFGRLLAEHLRPLTTSPKPKGARR